MALLTFVTACADYHLSLLARVQATVAAQTVNCEHIIIIDRDRLGAGWARNRGLEQVQTPFLAFLDADDELDPLFAEKCLTFYDGRRYVYSDWITERVVEAPDCAWRGDGSMHVITALLPTEWVRYIGGFDEQMIGGEDTEFWWKLTRAGLCGRRLAEPLFIYGREGQRSKAHVADPTHDERMWAILAKYKDKAMGCCSDIDPNAGQAELGQGLPGDVLARMLIPGPRSYIGRATGRLYQKNANSMELWMHPRDIDSQPQLFARVVQMPEALDEAEIARFRKKALEAVGGREAAVINVPTSEPQMQTVAAEPQPNISRVMDLYAHKH